jgi:hypothetical protein
MFGLSSWHNSSNRTMTIRSAQHLTGMNVTNLVWVKSGRLIVLTPSPSCVSRLYRTYGRFDVSQAWGPQLLFPGIRVLLFPPLNSSDVSASFDYNNPAPNICKWIESLITVREEFIAVWINPCFLLPSATVKREIVCFQSFLENTPRVDPKHGALCDLRLSFPSLWGFEFSWSCRMVTAPQG